jgi:hypothetical protein
VKRDPSVDYLTLGFILWFGIFVWVVYLTLPVPAVRLPLAPDAPLLHMAAMLPALPTNLDSTWRPTRRCGPSRGMTGEWIVCR